MFEMIWIKILDKPIGDTCVCFKRIFKIGVPEQHPVPGNFWEGDGG